MLKWINPKIRPVQTTQEQSSEGFKQQRLTQIQRAEQCCTSRRKAVLKKRFRENSVRKAELSISTDLSKCGRIAVLKQVP